MPIEIELKITISGKAEPTRAEVAGAVEAATGLHWIEGTSDEGMLEATRVRFRRKGMIVNMEAWSTVPEEDKAKVPALPPRLVSSANKSPPR
jgi:hypothetical protein